MHIRSSLNAINFRQFLLELCPFWTSNSYKYAVFRTFLLHALTYWAEILYITLFYCTTDQVWVSSICVNFCRSYALLELRILEIHSFPALFSSILWHIELIFYIWLCLTVLQIKVECRQLASIFIEVMPFFGTWNTGKTQFSALFSYLLWHIELKFFIWLCLMYYRSVSSVITLCPSGSPSVHPFSTLSSNMHWQI